MTDSLRIWFVGEQGEATPLSPLEQMPTELGLEDLLVRNPDMLGTGLTLVGRQTPTQGGWLDLLAIDEDGRLVVYELKRGTLSRDAVTQVLDYASALDAMSTADLAAHIAERSGNNGIEGIEDFEQWYVDNFGGDDLSRLLPPRMVLVGLGVDPVAERIAEFVSGGSLNLSVVTFHGFVRGDDQLLARQLEVKPASTDAGPRRRGKTLDEKRQALRAHLERNGHADLFDRVHTDIRELLPTRGIWEEPGRHGVSLQLAEPDKTYKTYFGVWSGYHLGSACSVSILPTAIDWGGDALQRLRASVELSEWPHGGLVCDFSSDELWTRHRVALLEFIGAVMANRSGGDATGT